MKQDKELPPIMRQFSHNCPQCGQLLAGAPGVRNWEKTAF